MTLIIQHNNKLYKEVNEKEDDIDVQVGFLIYKVNDDHWVVSGQNVRYLNDFGFSGWYWDRNENSIFHTKDTFKEVLELIMNKPKTKKRTLAKGV